MRTFGKLVLSLACSAAAFSSVPAFATNDTVLYRFTGKADGGNPIGGVVQDSAGSYYGETFQGGSAVCPNPPNNRQGCGTVYRLASDGTFTVLASFTGANGAHGNITPILVGNTLYGGTAQGGTAGLGVVFSVRTDGTGFTLLHQFAGPDGNDPQALVAGPGNVIYGITAFGGAFGYGSLFSISADGTYADLHDFNQPAAATPLSLVIAADTLVGSTGSGGGSDPSYCTIGCGTIFTYSTRTRVFKTVFTFPPSGKLGNYPFIGSVGPGPVVYGGGQTVIFSLSAATGYTQLLDLDFYANGLGTPSGPIFTPDGTLYGVLAGGAGLSNGLAYSLKGTTFGYQSVFNGSVPPRKDGASPMARLILNHDGNLVGTNATSGICISCGTIWSSIPGL